MIAPPSITTRAAMQVAVVHLVIPRTEMPRHFGAAVAEINAALAAQGIAALGPVIAHHLAPTPATFDFEVAIPVDRPVVPTGRVEPRDWPARKVATTVYRGSYEQLHGAWGHFNVWLANEGHRFATDLYETYLTDPQRVADPAAHETRLERPLAD